MTPGAPIRPLNGQTTRPEKVRKRNREKKEIERKKDWKKQNQKQTDGKTGINTEWETERKRDVKTKRKMGRGEKTQKIQRRDRQTD